MVDGCGEDIRHDGCNGCRRCSLCGAEVHTCLCTVCWVPAATALRCSGLEFPPDCRVWRCVVHATCGGLETYGKRPLCVRVAGDAPSQQFNFVQGCVGLVLRGGAGSTRAPAQPPLPACVVVSVNIVCHTVTCYFSFLLTRRVLLLCVCLVVLSASWDFVACTPWSADRVVSGQVPRAWGFGAAAAMRCMHCSWTVGV